MEIHLCFKHCPQPTWKSFEVSIGFCWYLCHYIIDFHVFPLSNQHSFTITVCFCGSHIQTFQWWSLEAVFFDSQISRHHSWNLLISIYFILIVSIQYLSYYYDFGLRKALSNAEIIWKVLACDLVWGRTMATADIKYESEFTEVRILLVVHITEQSFILMNGPVLFCSGQPFLIIKPSEFILLIPEW